jgi:hypothetical protein
VPGPVGKIRNPWIVILLSIITLGIYGIYWQYASFQEMKEYSGQGIGGVVGLVLAIFLYIVNIFLLPSEVGNLFAAEGEPKPVTGPTGFWILLPIIGSFIWFLKVQGSLNKFWQARGAVVGAA